MRDVRCKGAIADAVTAIGNGKRIGLSTCVPKYPFDNHAVTSEGKSTIAAELQKVSPLRGINSA